MSMFKKDKKTKTSENTKITESKEIDTKPKEIDTKPKKADTEPKETIKKYEGVKTHAAIRALLKSGKCSDKDINRAQEAMVKDSSIGSITLEEYEDIKKDPQVFLGRI